jgi:hypothetical protein
VPRFAPGHDVQPDPQDQRAATTVLPLIGN